MNETMQCPFCPELHEVWTAPFGMKVIGCPEVNPDIGYVMDLTMPDPFCVVAPIGLEELRKVGVRQ